METKESGDTTSIATAPSTGAIDGVSFDTRISLVDNIANLVVKEKQVLKLQLEEKTRQLEIVQKQLNSVQNQYHKLETYVSDQNEDASTAWLRASKQSSQSKRNALAKQWFAGSDIKGRSVGPHNATQNTVDRLVLSNQKLEPTQLTTLRKQIPLLPQLTSIDLTNTNLTDDDTPSIVEFFAPKCGLKEIILKNNHLNEKCFKAITNTLKSKAISGKQIVLLERLNLSHNPFAKHPKMGAILGDALKSNTTLRSLSVTLDDVATLRQIRGSSYLGNATQFILSMYHSPTIKNTTLQELTLSGTTISLKTMEALGRSNGLAFKSLTSLDMTSGFIGPQGCFELVNSITNVRPRKECTLRKLILRGNGLGDQGACELAHLFRTLIALDIRGNQIGEKGAVALGSGKMKLYFCHFCHYCHFNLTFVFSYADIFFYCTIFFFPRCSSSFSALENDIVLGTHHHKKRNLATSNRSRMTDRRKGSSGKKITPKIHRLPHVLRTLLLGDNPLEQNGGEAILYACRKCLSIHDVGDLSPTVPAALRQEIRRVLRENIIESSSNRTHCGAVPFGQSSVLKEAHIVIKDDKNIDDGNSGEQKTIDEDDAESMKLSSNYPRPCIHTYPWVVETNVPAASSNNITKESDKKTIRSNDGIDWTGWYRHYNVYLYRTSPATWEDGGVGKDGKGEICDDQIDDIEKKKNVNGEYRGLDIEFEGFATCTTDPVHRLALDGGSNFSSSSSGSRVREGIHGAAPRTTSLCYRIVRQTSNNDLPYPGYIVDEDTDERDEGDGLLYSLRLRPKDEFRAGDRLSVWIKPMSVSKTETAHLYTRNFYVRLPTDEWQDDYDDSVLHDQTFHQLNIWNGDQPFM